MKKQLKLPVRFERAQYDEQTCFEMSFGKNALSDWCLGLSLLKESLIENLVIEPETGKYRLELQVGRPSGPDKIPGTLRNDMVSLKLTPTSLDYLLTFFLKYYRDGSAAVNHIDLEAAFKDLGDDVYIIFKFADVAPPMSADEVKKKLRH